MGGDTTEPPPSTQIKYGTCASISTKPHPTSIVFNPPSHSPNSTLELIERVNEADIFVGDIQIMVLIDTGVQASTITEEICKQHGHDIHPMKQM